MEIGNKFIKPEVEQGKTKQKSIHFYDLLEKEFKPTEYMKTANMRYMSQASTGQDSSYYPEFIPDKSSSRQDTVYYLHKFYECVISEEFPYEFHLYILPGTRTFCINKVTDYLENGQMVHV